MTDHSLFSLLQEADVPVDNVRMHVILDYHVPVETDLLKVSENLISEIKFSLSFNFSSHNGGQGNQNLQFYECWFDLPRYSSWPDICVHVQVTSSYYRYFTYGLVFSSGCVGV